MSERDICTKFITPALRKSGWDEMSQIREEVFFTKGRIIVRGIGLSPFDFGTMYGSPSRLQGVHYFPIDEFFDAGEVAMNHEFGHQWINFATDSRLSPGRPHWPPADVANGVMGFSIGGTGGQGGQFPYALTPVGGGQYRVDQTPASTLYTAWDLYLMGLLPSDSVPPMRIFPSGYAVGQTVSVTTYIIADYIVSHGARVPAAGAAQKDFLLAIVVLSYGRLLSASEMAFFSFNAQRAEARTTLPFSIGLASGTTSPFWVATGGRATLRTRIE